MKSSTEKDIFTMFFHKKQNLINDLTNLTPNQKKNLFTDVKCRKFIKEKFLSKEIIENNFYDINQIAELVFLYCSCNPYSHNLKNISLLQQLLQNQHKFSFTKKFYIDLIPEKMFISLKTFNTLINDFPYLREEIFLHCLRFYIDFLIEQKNDFSKLLDIWNNYFAFDKKFPIQYLITSVNIQRMINNTSSLLDVYYINDEIGKFEKKRVIYLILILSRKSKLNFENKLIFEFLFGKNV